MPSTVPSVLRAALFSRIGLLGLCAIACGCGAGPGGTSGTGGGAGASGGRVRVLASIAPLAALARSVGGDRVEVVTLVPPGASEHTWEPGPRDAARFAGAAIFIEVGLGFEAWAGKLAAAGDTSPLVIDASEGVDLIRERSEPTGPTAAAGPGARRTAGGGQPSAGQPGGEGSPGAPAVGARRAPEFSASPANPHYWLDPHVMEKVATRIGEALARVDPAQAAEYRRRGSETSAALEALDTEIAARLSTIASRKLVTFHPAWDYFARRYGLLIVGSIEESPGREPGPRQIAALAESVRSEGVRAIFAEPQYPPKAAEVLAAECGVPVLTLDPLGGEGVAGRGDYFSLLRYNVSVLEEALR